MDRSTMAPEGTPMGPFKLAFSWRSQVVSAFFVLGQNGEAGLRTKVLLWGRPFTVDDPAFRWGHNEWFQFAVKVAALSAAVGGRRPDNLPIEPTSIREALTEAFGPNPPDATFHLPQRPHHLAAPDWH